MKQLIATLRFYLDNETADLSSAEIQTGKNEYAIYIRPENDKNFLELLGLPKTQKTMQTVIAHELGHFVAEVTKDVSHNHFLKTLIGPVLAEKKAWDIAEEITDVDKDVKNKALETYADYYSK